MTPEVAVTSLDAPGTQATEEYIPETFREQQEALRSSVTELIELGPAAMPVVELSVEERAS